MKSMSQLTQEDIGKIADLAKIELTQAELSGYLADINNILGHLAMVSEAKIENPTNSFRFFNQLRVDSRDERDFDRDMILENIPNKSNDNYVKVNKVIKK